MESMVVIGIVGFVVIVVLKFVLMSPAKVGARGERRVAGRLREGLPPEYVVVNDLYLPLDDGTTTQIDHVVVGPTGIFVIETKNYSGWIFANASSAKWTQTLYRKKSQFQNPLRQNYRHICAIADNFGISKSLIHGLVVFAGDCTFKTEIPDGVVRLRDAAAQVLKFKEFVFTSEQVQKIVAAFAEKDLAVGEAGKAAHVANLKKRHGEGLNGIRSSES